MKICRRCEVEKDLNEFHKATQNKDGRKNTCKLCAAICFQDYKIKDPDRLKEKWKASSKKYHTYEGRREKTLNKYNLTSEKFNELLDKQNGLCWICQDRPATDVDHCHKTNVVRGILCNKCNTGLGLFKDNVKFLQKAIEYLGK
jgi:Autographiviridae endonuclease VII